MNLSTALTNIKNQLVIISATATANTSNTFFLLDSIDTIDSIVAGIGEEDVSASPALRQAIASIIVAMGFLEGAVEANKSQFSEFTGAVSYLVQGISNLSYALAS